MRKHDFLKKLSEENKLELVEESEEICKSYLIKSENCFKSARVLLESELYENSMVNSYYAMYNGTIALLFRCGIKCENHSVASFLLGELFGMTATKIIIEQAKKDRIDQQYYINPADDLEVNANTAKQMLLEAENIILELRTEINKLSSSDVIKIRNKFKELI
ncbi:MAG TPA: HEPN domain-containing protein [Candidatus Nanoarchaeia archaeon]|nr:HEPN domain-containing protein [Candidatus Nanoarchaeia archaeon]